MLLRGVKTSRDGGLLVEVEDTFEFKELKAQVEELRKLVHTLLNVICEESDGIMSGAVSVPPGSPRQGLCM